jgi:hypothetical protein
LGQQVVIDGYVWVLCVYWLNEIRNIDISYHFIKQASMKGRMFNSILVHRRCCILWFTLSIQKKQVKRTSRMGTMGVISSNFEMFGKLKGTDVSITYWCRIPGQVCASALRLLK